MAGANNDVAFLYMGIDPPEQPLHKPLWGMAGAVVGQACPESHRLDRHRFCNPMPSIRLPKAPHRSLRHTQGSALPSVFR